MQYSKKILNYFHNPKHCGEFNASHSGSAEDHSVSDKVRIYLEIVGDTIRRANFKALGNVTTIALAEYCCELMEGKTVSDGLHLTSQQLLEALQLPATKIHSAELIIAALQQALKSIR